MKNSTAALLLATLFSSSLAIPHQPSNLPSKAVSTSTSSSASTSATTCATAAPISQSAYYCSGYTTGCSPGGCAYSFNVTFAGSAFEPAFTTFCQGVNVAGKLQPCADPSVSSNGVPNYFQGDDVVVAHTFTKTLLGSGGGVKTYVVSGNTSVVDDHSTFPYSFVVVPSSVEEL